MSARSKLTVPELHQLRVARDTLRMNPVMVAVMGGMTAMEAETIIARLTGEHPRPLGAPQGGACYDENND